MTKEYKSQIKTNEDVSVGGITLTKREDCYYAVQGGGYIKDRGHAERAAKTLARSYPQTKTKLIKLVDKTVKRLNGASRETSVMSA